MKTLISGVGVWLLLFCCTAVDAVSVNRVELSPRREGIFAENVRMALNTKTGQTLVVWERHPGTHGGHSIWGRLLAPTGAPLGAEFQIVSGPNTYGPDLVYNPANNQFVLAYSNELFPNGRFALQAQRLNASGRRMGAPVFVSPDADRKLSVGSYFVQTLYDEATNGIIVVWLRYGFGSTPIADEGLQGTVLNANLTARRSPLLLSKLQRINGSATGPYVTDLALHRPSGKLLLAGYSVTNITTGYAFRYFVSRTNPAMDRGNVALTPLKAGESQNAAPHASLAQLPNGQTLAFYVEGTGIRRRAINNLGSPSGPIQFLFGQPATAIPLEFPNAATGTRAGSSETVVVGQEDSTNLTGKLWMQKMTSTGALSGAPVTVHSGYTGTAPPAILTLPAAQAGGFRYATVMVEGVQLSSPPMPGQLSIPVLLIVTTP